MAPASPAVASLQAGLGILAAEEVRRAELVHLEEDAQMHLFLSSIKHPFS